MIQILQFLKILQRIIVFLVILGFIPLGIYVFSAKSLNISDQAQIAYRTLYNQLTSGFVVDMRKNCSLQDAIRANRYCFQYCELNKNCSIIDSNKNCLIGQLQYSNFDRKYCAQKTIKNNLITTNTSNITVQYSESLPPLFSVQQNRSVYYVYNNQLTKKLDKQTCSDILYKYGPNIQQVQKIQSQSYIMTLRYLFYTLIPIYIFTFISTIIETFTKFDYKRVMQISLFNTCIISMTMIIIGILFDYKCSQLEKKIQFLGGTCLVSSNQSYSIHVNLSSDLHNGVSTIFTIIMGVVGFFQGFLIVFLLILWIIQIKMHKLRKQDTSSGYELQTL